MTGITGHAMRLFMSCCLFLLLCATAQAADIRETSLDEAAALLRNPPADLVIVDIRTPEEFRNGHLPGAVNMDFFGPRFDVQLSTLPQGAPVLLYCRTGNRSSQALDRFKKTAAGTVYHLTEGISAWVKAGHAVTQ